MILGRMTTRFCLFVSLSLTCSWLGCTPPPAQVSFKLKGTVPSKDGSFTNQFGWTILPTDVRLVIGDLQLKREVLDEKIKLFSSLPSLLAPGEELPADQIGKLGQFPGMWAINIMYNATPHTFPTGKVESANWNQIQLRMSPAVSGVRGLTPNDPLLQNTLLIIGQIRKGTAVCKLRLRAPLELGIAMRVNFTSKSTLVHRNTIEIQYNMWLNDVQFGTLCSSTTKNTIEIDSNNHPQIIESIRNAVAKSVKLIFSQGSAQ